MKKLNSDEKGPVNIVFDFDGTLHDSRCIYPQAFRETCTQMLDHMESVLPYFTDEEICKWLGGSSKEMWDSFLPDLSEEKRKKCESKIAEKMVSLIKQGKSNLYPGTYQMLSTLKASGYRMFILNRCQHKCMDAQRELFGLDAFFTEYYCAGDYGDKSKEEIFPLIMERYDGSFIVVGDRGHDIRMAKKYNCHSIGCAYGFGTRKELAEADKIITSVSMIPNKISALR